MTARVRLNNYERGIVTTITKDFGLDLTKARQLVVEYIEVVRKLGGYDNCEDHADRLVRAQKIGYTPEAWMKRIREIDHEELRDPTISGREHSQYAHN